MRTFSASTNFSATERPAGDRVVASPEWPAPYYQRLFRSYPTRLQNTYDLGGAGAPYCQYTIYEAKRHIASTKSGASTIQNIEDGFKLDSYVMRQTDSGRMAQSYVSDLVDFIDVANKENKRILIKKNLF
jgi:hypothetical protein